PSPLPLLSLSPPPPPPPSPLALHAALPIFGQLLPADVLFLFQIRQGAGHLQRPMGGAPGQTKAFCRPFQPALILGIQTAVLTDPAQLQMRIETVLASKLEFPGGADPGGGFPAVGPAGLA